MLGGGVSTAAENRTVRHAVVHPVRADRGAVVGRVLDQQELRSGARVARSHHGADDDHGLGGVEGRPRLLSQGPGRLVCCMYGLRLQRLARIRLHQRVRSHGEQEEIHDSRDGGVD